MHQFHDRRSDFRRQTLPVCDKLLECRISADQMQTGGIVIDTRIMLQNDLRNMARGCNSRRLQFPAEFAVNG